MIDNVFNFSISEFMKNLVVIVVIVRPSSGFEVKNGKTFQWFLKKSLKSFIDEKTASSTKASNFRNIIDSVVSF